MPLLDDILNDIPNEWGTIDEVHRYVDRWARSSISAGCKELFKFGFIERRPKGRNNFGEVIWEYRRKQNPKDPA